MLTSAGGTVRWPVDDGRAGPTDLTCLAPLDSLFVKQEIEMLEALTGIETQNKYKVYAKTHPNAPMFLAKEESDFCARNCLGNMRPFRLNIGSPVTGHTIITCVRPYKCCLSEMFVEDGRGTLLGSIRQKCVCCARIFHVYDAHDQPLFEIYGPWYVRSALDGWRAANGCIEGCFCVQNTRSFV